MLLQNLLDAVRPLQDERPFEPLIHTPKMMPGDQRMMLIEAVSAHPVRTCELLRIEDCAALLDGARRGELAVFRLGYAASERRVRILDFLCGGAMVMRAGLYRIAEQTYLLSPDGVCVDPSLLRRLEQAGCYYRDSRTKSARLA